MDTINLALLLAVALVNLLTAAIVLGLRGVLLDMAKNVLRIEVATNSMKDALVATTAKASHAEGVADQREKGDEVVAAIVKNLPDKEK